ncbi:MAG: PorP/SprF family type IX secretion system membrane protein [Chitinophagaceae bacterium]|nr:PorP/SprF family type IX secretion system membrane protein [Chitinophagaceae bacterium]
MKKTKIIFYIFLIIGILGEGYAQNKTIITQYMLNGIVLNPAYAGSHAMVNTAVLHRNQWINIDGAPTLNLFTMDMHVPKTPISVGISLSNTNIGINTVYSILSSYAYRIPYKHGNLSFGLSIGMSIAESNYNKLTLKDKADPFLSGIISTYTPDFGVGVYYYNSKTYFGFSIPYILQTRIFNNDSSLTKFQKTPYIFINFGKLYRLHHQIQLQPSILFRIQDVQNFGADINLIAIFHDILGVGLSYKTENTLSILSQLYFHENFRFSYSYDVLSSGLSAYTTGTHEFMIIYRIRLKGHKSNKTLCPSYF